MKISSFLLVMVSIEDSRFKYYTNLCQWVLYIGTTIYL